MSYNVLANKWAIYKEDDQSTHKLKFRYGFIPDEEKENVLDWHNRLQRILNKIKLCDPDIICLQEVELEHIQTNFIDNLLNYNNMHHTIWKKGDEGYKRSNDIGNITLWKKDKLTCITDVKDAFNSCAIFTELVHHDTNFKFLLINVHLLAGLNSGAETRGKQIISCCKKIKKVPTCICGDFNEELNVNSPCKDILYVKDILDKYNFIVSHRQITCNVYWHETKTNYYHAFDHVVTCGFNNVMIEDCPAAEPIPNVNEPSDHYPLIFKFILKQL